MYDKLIHNTFFYNPTHMPVEFEDRIGNMMLNYDYLHKLKQIESQPNYAQQVNIQILLLEPK